MRRSLHAMLIAFAAMHASVSSATGPGTGDEIRIEIREPMPPKRGVRTVSGYCGSTRYEAALGPKPLALSVDGAAVADAELAEVLALVPNGLFILDARLIECLPGDDTLIAWLLLDGPGSGGPRGLQFRLDPAGRVSGVAPD